MRLANLLQVRYLYVPTIKLFEKQFKLSDPHLETYYKTALDLTKHAGRYIFKKMSQEKVIEIKSTNIDLVTETDKAVETMLSEGLSTAFPDHKFIGEETVSSGKTLELTDDPTWIIDPVDGTMNFVHSFPYCCISVSLFIDSNPVIGIVNNPSLNQIFTAVKGGGAYCNDKPIHVSKQTQLSKALLIMEVGSSMEDEKIKSVYHNYINIAPKVHGIRALGACAMNMCMIAMGSVEAYFDYGTHIWDIGAGELIIKEAGGIIIDPKGGKLDRLSRRILCANNKQIAQQLIPNLKQYYPPRE